MSKAIVGAALLVGDAAFILATAGTGLAGVLALTNAELEIMGTVAAAGVGLIGGAIADALTDNRGMDITTRQPAANRQIIYGMQRVGGVLVYESTTGSHKDQYNMVIVLAGHVCWGIASLYLDGRLVYFDQGYGSFAVNGLPSFGGSANGGTYTGPDGNQYNFGGMVYCEPRYGNQPAGVVVQNGVNLGVPASLTANDPTWSANGSGSPDLMGCAYVYLKCEYNTNLFPERPEVRVTMYGKPVYDPRTGETAYSANSALVAADWISDTTYGLGMTVNQEQLIAAANVCDEQIALAAGGTEAQFQCHTHFDTGTAPSDVLGTILKSMGGRISVIGGEVYIWPAYWQGPSASFDASALTAPVKWTPTRSLKDLCNRVTGTYCAPNFPYNIAGNLYDSNGFFDGQIQNNFQFGFQATNFPQYAADPQHGYATDQYLNEDSGVPADVQTFGNGAYQAGSIVLYNGGIWKAIVNQPSGTPGTSADWVNAANPLPMEAPLNMVLSIAQAQRLAKIMMLRNRNWGSGQLEMRMAALTLQECDVMQFTLPQHGWTDKQLEIVGCTWKVVTHDAQPGQLAPAPEVRVLFDVIETSPSIYEWETSEEQTVYDIPALPRQTSSTVAPPTGLTLVSDAATALVSTSGQVSPQILLSWDVPEDGFVTGIQIQYQLSGAGATWQRAAEVDAASTEYFLYQVLIGNSYNVRIRSVRPSGATSVWVEVDGCVTGMVLDSQTADGVGQGSLTAIALTSGAAEIVCNPFTALIGQISLPIFPGGAVTLTNDGTIGGAGGLLALQTQYFVYYVDPTSAGGNVTPIATTRSADFLGKLGYWLIAEIVTPSVGASSGPRFYPTSATDVGNATTPNPGAAYDGNLATYATFSGPGSGGADDCLFAGFPPITLSADATLTVVATVAAADFAIVGTVAGTATTMLAATSAIPQAVYTLDVPSGTLLSGVSVEVFTQTGSGQIFEVYIQATASAPGRPRSPVSQLPPSTGPYS